MSKRKRKNNPCCGCCTETTKPVCKKQDENCLIFCNLYYDVRVEPCGGDFSINLFEGYSHKLAGCSESELILDVVSHSDGLSNIDVASGVLSGATSSFTGDEAVVSIKVTCGNLENVFTVTIPIIDNCKNSNCDPKCEICNPCSGICEEALVEIEIIEIT